MRVGVLAFQGDFAAHQAAIERCGAEALPIKHAEQLETCAALILPGGESTTIGKLICRWNLAEPLREFAAKKPIFGTCAGLILLATDIVGSDQFRLGVMKMTVERNAYGRQVESFETDLEAPALGVGNFRGVFIRAPQIVSLGKGVEPLVYHEGKVVLCRQGRLLAATFHPELTLDTRVHRYFLEM